MIVEQLQHRLDAYFASRKVNACDRCYVVHMIQQVSERLVFEVVVGNDHVVTSLHFLQKSRHEHTVLGFVGFDVVIFALQQKQCVQELLGVSQLLQFLLDRLRINNGLSF